MYNLDILKERSKLRKEKKNETKYDEDNVGGSNSSNDGK